jgi:hypothetical protein
MDLCDLYGNSYLTISVDLGVYIYIHDFSRVSYSCYDVIK